MFDRISMAGERLLRFTRVADTNHDTRSIGPVRWHENDGPCIFIFFRYLSGMRVVLDVMKVAGHAPERGGNEE